MEFISKMKMKGLGRAKADEVAKPSFISNWRKTLTRVLLAFALLSGIMYFARPSLSSSQNVEYSTSGYTLLGSDSGVFNYGGSPFSGNCYTVNCGFTPSAGSFPTAAVDRQTGGYTFMNSTGALYNFGGPGGSNFSGPNPWVSLADNYAGTGMYAMDNYGNVYTNGGATFYGSAGNCACYNTIIPLPTGGYEVLAYNGFIAGYGPGAFSIGSLPGVSNIVSGTYDAYTGQILVLSSSGVIYNDGPTGQYTLASFSPAGTPVSISANNYGNYDATTNQGYVYAYSNGQVGAQNYGGMNGGASDITTISLFNETPTLSSASISNNNALTPGTITVNGNGFINGDSTIYVNGSPISTTWVNGGVLQGTLSSKYTTATTLSVYVGSSFGNTSSTNISLICPAPSLSYSGATSSAITSSVTLTETISNECGDYNFSIGSLAASSYSQISSPSFGTNVYSVTYPVASNANIGYQNVQITPNGAGATSGAVASPQFEYTFTSGATLTTTPSNGAWTATFTGNFPTNSSNTLAITLPDGKIYNIPAVSGTGTSVSFNVPSWATMEGNPTLYTGPTSGSTSWGLATTINGVTSTTNGTYNMTGFYTSAPTITVPNITNGGGSLVTVTGNYLAGTTSVTFTNGANTVTVPVTLTSSTAGTLITPTSTQLGIISPSTSVSYSLISDSYSSAAQGSATFVSVYSSQSSPTITVPSITNGGGSLVTVTGNYLAGTTSVTFTNGANTVTVPVTLSSSTSGTLTTPTASALGVSSPNTSVAYTVSSDGYSNVSPSNTNFVSIYSSLPTIAVPNITNDGGNSVTISGANLAGTTSVTFTNGANTVTVPVTLSSSTSGTLTAPTASALGVSSPNTSVAYTVSSDGYSNVSPSSTTFVSVYGSPTVTLLSPTNFSYDGGTLTVSGTNFAGSTSITIQGSASGSQAVTVAGVVSSSGSATFDLTTNDLLSANHNTQGSINVSLTTDYYSSIQAGTISLQLPAISSISPTVLQFTGGQIIIAGSYLPNNSLVTFSNGSNQYSVQASSTNADQIVVTAPTPDKLGLNYPGSVSVTVAPSGLPSFASNPVSISYATTARTKTSILNLIVTSGSLSVDPEGNNNDITGHVGESVQGYLPPAYWQDATGLGDGWDGQAQATAFVYTGTWFPLGVAQPLSISTSSPYTGTQDGITYTVTVTGSGTATYSSNTSNDPNGTFTFTAGSQASFGANGLSISIPSGVTSGTYEIHVGSQSRNALTLDNTNPPAAVGSSVGNSQPPAFVNDTAPLPYGASASQLSYGSSVKFVDAPLYTGMGSYLVQPLGSVAIDSNSWAATYTSNIQYNIVSGP